MIASFKDKASEDIFNGVASKQARKACPQSIWHIATRKLDQLDSVVELEELKVPPGNRLEALKGDFKGFHSIRINAQWRIVFRWQSSDAYDVQIIDYH